MPTYRFTLITNNGSFDFDTSKVGNWQDLKPTLQRNGKYIGLMPSFTNTFEFVDNIRDELVRLFDVHGHLSEAALIIYTGNDNGERNSFVELGEGQQFKGNFTDPKPTWDEISFNLNFEDSSFNSKFFSRKKEKINYNKTKSLDGGDMSAYELDTITLHDRTILLQSLVNQLTLPGYGRGAITGSFTFFTTEENDIIQSANSDVKKTFDYPGQPPNNDVTSYFYLQSEEDTVIDISFDPVDVTIISWDVLNDIEGVTDGFTEFNFQLKIARHDIDFNFVDYPYESDILTITPSDVTDTKSLSLDQSISINQDESLRFEFHVTGNNTANDRGIQITYGDDINISIDRTTYFPQTTANFILPHKLFERYAEFITGEKNALYAPIFGRVEDGYAEDGELAYLGALD
jgi:hypothetical protein